MRNIDQCPQGILYNSFSVMLFQTFTTEKISTNLEINPLIEERKFSEESIDRQIFVNGGSDKIKRYALPSFDTHIEILEPKKFDSANKPLPRRRSTLEGTVQVRASVFFDKTVLISYRFVVDLNDKDNSPCRTSQPLNSNEMISIASLTQNAEHWGLNDAKTDQEIDQSVNSIKVFNLPIGLSKSYASTSGLSPKDVFLKISTLYRALFDDSVYDKKASPNMYYTMIDVWEDFDLEQGELSLASMDEDQIIEHIEKYHKPELVGIMSLYPYEWPYRSDLSYADICGGNIAIDVDDLVLANQNVCLIFGTYGKRGNESETDWKEHLKIRSLYGCSWSEYLFLLELLLVKKQTIKYVLRSYVDVSDVMVDNDTKVLIRQIENNAYDSIKMTRMLIELNATRYLRFVSHKHMYKTTALNMNIEQDEQNLSQTMSNIDNALINTNNIIQARQSEMTKNILFFISIASLFSVLMENDNIPVLSLIAPNLSINITIILEVVTFFAIMYGCHKLIQSVKENKIKKKYKSRL